MAVPVLNDYEYQFGDVGTVLNPTAAGVAATLPFVDITTVEGLDTPEYRISEHDHEGVDGGYTDAEFLRARVLTMSGTIFADGNDPETILDSLKYDFRPSTVEVPFYFKHPGKPVRVVFAKPLGVRYNVEQLRRIGQTPVQFLMTCPTPYIYDAGINIYSGSVIASNTGFGFDLAFNLSFGGSVVNPGVTVSNFGNHRAYPLITIRGPVTTPTLTESNTGRTISFNTSLLTGDIVYIDTRKHTAVLNGVGSIRGLLLAGSRWFYVDPGQPSTITFTGDLDLTGTATGTGTSATTDYLHTTDADAADINVGDTCWLQNSLSANKEPYTVTVTSKVSAAGNTDIFFSPSATAVTVSGDKLVAGIPTYDVNVYNTWY
jgi:phage-related protein